MAAMASSVIEIGSCGDDIGAPGCSQGPRRELQRRHFAENVASNQKISYDTQMLITGNQLKAARALAGMDQLSVAQAAGLAVNTIRLMESRGPRPITSGAVTVRSVQSALESRGVEFINGNRPGVQLGAYSVEESVPGLPDVVKNLRHYVHREDAIAATRALLEAAQGTGKVFCNRRQGYWWTGVGYSRTAQRFTLRGPLGPAIDDLNVELNIPLEQE
jgi:hypothetical protein